MKKFNIIVFGIVGILVLVVFASGCTSSDTANNTKKVAAATFDNGVISFQYPSNYTVNSSADKSAMVNTPRKPIIVQKSNKTQHDKNDQNLGDGFHLTRTVNTTDGGSYKMWVATSSLESKSGSYTLVDFEIVKNGNYYQILGTTDDIFIMDQIANSIK